MRVYPSVFLNARWAVRDTVLPRGGGPDGQSPCFVPKGQKVLIGINANQRRVDIWGLDADVFRPERWADENLRPGLAYTPFSTGPRICLGQQVALTTAGYTLVRLLQACPDIENRDPRPYKEMVKVISDSANGVLVGRRQ